MPDVNRIAALKRTAFEKSKFDGFVIFKPSNLIYFTSVPGTTSLLVPEDGEITLYVYGVNYEQAKAEGKNLRVELVKREENLMAKIVQQAKEHNLGSLAVDALDAENWLALARQTRGIIKLKIKGSLVSSLRAVKDKDEIECMQKAADLTSAGIKTAYETISAGMKEYEVAAEIEYAMRKKGSHGTAFETAVSSGPSSAFPHGGCSDRTIRNGDLVVLDFGAVYKYYRSDITRTLVVGKPSEKQKRLHKIVMNAQQIAFEAVKSNAKAKEVDAVARKKIQDAGYGEYFVHGLGHGVGIDIHESPTLSPSSKEELKVGNVVTDEPGIYLPGYGGVRIEDTLLVLSGGARRLTQGPFGLNLE